MYNVEKFKSDFLSDCYNDLIKNYNNSLENNEKSLWDYIVITASNEDQAKSYKNQINNRINNKMILSTNYIVIPDYNNERIGSGGSTIYVIKKLIEDYKISSKDKVLLIHSGGDSKRIPQFSYTGKLFSPVPKSNNLKDLSSLFDELMVTFSTIPNRMDGGIVVTCGDALLLFNPLQLDFQYKETVIVTMKDTLENGVNHGVTVTDSNNNVIEFLHKKSSDILNLRGAVNNSTVNIDTGISYLSYKVIKKIYDRTLLSFEKYVNSNVRLNYFADFLTPMSSFKKMEEYLMLEPENGFSDNLRECRIELFNLLKEYTLYDVKAYPASFIHFGTTKEYINLITDKNSYYKSIGWKKNFNSTISKPASFNSVLKDTVASSKSLIFNSKIENCVVEKGSMLYNCVFKNSSILKDYCFSTYKLKNGKYVTRVFKSDLNPKNKLIDFTDLKNAFNYYNFDLKKYYKIDISIWEAELFVTGSSIEEACNNSLKYINILCKKATNNDFEEWLLLKKESLFSSFNNAIGEDRLIDNQYDIDYQSIIDNINYKKDLKYALKIYENSNYKEKLIKSLSRDEDNLNMEISLRVLYLLSVFDKKNSKIYYNKIFNKIKESFLKGNPIKYYNIKCNKKKSEIKLPARINFCGGWTDTPPYCFEHGGSVLNCAIKLNNELPVYASVEKLNKNAIIFECKDLEIEYEVKSINELLEYNNPNDLFALIKSGLFVSSIVRDSDTSLENIFLRMNGGFKITTHVKNIPRGSGLGTSSILSSALLKVLYDYCGVKNNDNFIINEVLKLEQVMSTAGGWQDQIGGLLPGMKMISTRSGMNQEYEIKPLKFKKAFLKELNNRIIIINTGQRRLARNLLRDIVLKYISNEQQTLKVLEGIKNMAKRGQEFLLKEDLDSFAKLLTEHFELVKKMDPDTTNICIDNIFKSLDDLIIGKSIIGAGGGGFILAILKNNIAKKDIEQRLAKTFYDTDIKVWESSIYE